MVDNFKERVFPDSTGRCTYERIVIMTTCPRPAQAPARSNPSIDGVSGYGAIGI